MSLRDDALRVLGSWSAPDADQERLRLAYGDYLTAHADGVWKSCPSGHLTASALVIDPAAGRVLLTLHRKIRAWLQLGGHCEPGDATVADAALREATEESGISGLTLVPGGPVLLSRHRTPCAWHLDVQYAVLAPEGSVERVSEESLELGWFAFDAVPDVTDDPSVRQLVTRSRALV